MGPLDILPVETPAAGLPTADSIATELARALYQGENRRLSRDEALALLRDGDLFTLGLLANKARERYHAPTAPITFVIDRNLSYTNICNVDCMFCAFYRSPGDAEGYTLDYDTIAQKAQELVDANGTQLLIQGGVNPDLPFSFYTDMISRLRRDFPTLTLHAFSPTELSFMAHITGKPLDWVIAQLIEAGMDSIPGGGAELLSDRVRDKVSPKKVNSHSWLEVMEVAHGLGLKTSATMMWGFGPKVESDEDIVDHLLAIRDLQYKTGGFTAFIPWTFQKANTKLEKLPGATVTGIEYLRVMALSRLVLDNVANIQASWITQGLKLCQTALSFGANDIGGLLLEENVVTAAGVTAGTMPLEEALKAIHGVGRDAAQRDTQYRQLRHYPRAV